MSVITIIWVHVPPDTQLEVSVAPQGGAFISGGDIFMQDKGQVPIKQWSDAQLRPGPAVELLKTGVDYTVDIRVASVSSAVATGTVTATLREASTGTELDTQPRAFNVPPGTHDLIRIFVDADPVPAPVPAPAGPGGGRGVTSPVGRRAPTPRSRGRKRGK